jgi:hypothetical protein
MSVGSIMEAAPGAYGQQIRWCDCDHPCPYPGVKTGPAYCLPPGSGGCGGWIRIHAGDQAAWRTVSHLRPKDRFTNAQASTFHSWNVGKGTVARLEEAHEFNGFCTPCGGLRKHRLGCPVKRSKT